MPYIITTKVPRATARTANGADLEAFERRTTPDYDVRSHRAVATLDNARLVVRTLVVDSALSRGTTEGYPASARIADPITESGGAVGPLPDGTLIEVEELSWLSLAARIPDCPPVISAHLMLKRFDLVIDAYNVAREAT